MSFYIIILESSERAFIVSATRNPIACWQKHNKGYHSNSKLQRPWDLIYIEQIENKFEIHARKKILLQWICLDRWGCLTQSSNKVKQMLIHERHQEQKEPIYIYKDELHPPASVP